MTSVETADIKALGSSSSGWSTLHHIFKVKGYFGPLKTSVEHNVVTENFKKNLLLGKKRKQFMSLKSP